MNRIEVLDGQGWIELTDHMGDELRIVDTARIAYGGRSNNLSESDLAVLEGLLKNGHTSPLEHVVFTFHAYAPIFVVRHWFRHRSWSYSELSRRYTRKDIAFYTPSHFNGDGVAEEDKAACQSRMIKAAMAAVDLYHELLGKGVKPEQARTVLPVSLMTEFYATVDLNNLLKFLSLRCDQHAQWEIRQYAEAIKPLVSGILPHVARFLGW